MIKKQMIFILVCVLTISVFVFAGQTNVSDFKKLYESTLKMDTNVNFTELRLFYTKSAGYDPTLMIPTESTCGRRFLNRMHLI